jgi:hypothetical protein
MEQLRGSHTEKWEGGLLYVERIIMPERAWQFAHGLRGARVLGLVNLDLSLDLSLDRGFLG